MIRTFVPPKPANRQSRLRRIGFWRITASELAVLSQRTTKYVSVCSSALPCTASKRERRGNIESARGRVPHAPEGFTVPEMAISLVVAGVLALVIFSVTFYYYANALQAQTATNLGIQSQTILTQMTDDIRLADAISTTNAIYDPNMSGGWTTSNPSNVLIIENPATDASHNIIYNSDTGFPYRNEYIYFKSGNSLYKRVLANTAASGNTAVTTCPADQASPSCPPDRLFSDNVSNLSFTFYDSSGNTTADASSARSVSLEADMSKKTYGKDITLTNSTRVTLRNQ